MELEVNQPFPRCFPPRMIGDRSRKQELVCRKEGRPEIGAVIILISVYSTSVLPAKKNILSVVGLVLFQNRKSNFHGKKQVL